MAKGITKRSDDYSQWYIDVVLKAQLAETQAHLTRAIDFIKKAGHLPGCGVVYCIFCGHAEGHGHHGPPTVSFNHDFQPGPCTCGHDRIVGSAGA